MESSEFKRLFTIDTDRLLSYYKRLQNQFKNLTSIQITARFLKNNQSIGTSIPEIESILRYYQKKIRKSKSIVDFGLEWIRAVKIRFEYKKYLSNSQFPNFDVALDECIFLYFLPYDDYIRKLLIEDIKEFEISALYTIFFSPPDRINSDFSVNIEKHKNMVPTIFLGTNRINTNLITLRSGLSEVIKSDYDTLTHPRKRKLL